MKKRIILFMVICFCSIIGIRNVSAKEVYYTNEKGFEFSEDEYTFFKKVYGEKLVQKYFDENLYDDYAGIDFANTEVQTKKYTINESRQPLLRDSPYYSTPAKSIQISNVCTSILCKISVTATWLGDPTVKSYDDIGMCLAGVTRVGSVPTIAYSDTNDNVAAATKYQSNGFGATVLLPQGNDIVILQSLDYLGHGTVYASYQHAMSTSSLTLAQQFNIDPVGYGEVFGFYGGAEDIYDAMNGVNLVV